MKIPHRLETRHLVAGDWITAIHPNSTYSARVSAVIYYAGNPEPDVVFRRWDCKTRAFWKTEARMGSQGFWFCGFTRTEEPRTLVREYCRHGKLMV